MSARRSRVRPVPDFSRAHQLFESQLEARKKEMKKCTKVEEFNLSKPLIRSDGSSATPVQCLDISKPSPRHPDIARLQTNPIRSPIVSSSDVKVPKPKDCTVVNCEPGLRRKATGILKNAGKTDEATIGQQQACCAGAPLGRRPRVTFDIASPVTESPISVAKRVHVTGWSHSPSKRSPRPAASRMLIACNRIPAERNGTGQSTRSERQQPRRVLLFGSGQRITTSQSCSRAACMGGFSRFRADSIAKAIDFNEESEEDGQSQDVLRKAQQTVETSTGVSATKRKFGGLKRSPVRKIHVDVTENEDLSVSSPLLRLNTNSEAVIRSPLLRKFERIEQVDAKNRSRLPQPKDQKGKLTGKENRSNSFVEKKNKPRDERESIVADGGSQFDKTDSDECRMRNSQDHHVKVEASSPSIKRDALEQLEATDTFDANQTISRLEKKAQRLRRRSQVTEEKSELDCIMKKLEALEKKIESMRMGFHSVRQAASSNTAGDCGSCERSISTSDDPEPSRLMRNESNVCPTDRVSESWPIHLESKTESQSREEMCETSVVTSEVEPEPREDTQVSNALVHGASEVEPEPREDTQVSNVLVHGASDFEPEAREDTQVSNVLVRDVSEVETESREDTQVSNVLVHGASDFEPEAREDTQVSNVLVRDVSEVETEPREDTQVCIVLVHGVSEVEPELREDTQVEPESRADTQVCNAVVHVVSEVALEFKEDKISEVSHVALASESKSMEHCTSDVSHFFSEIESLSMDNVLCDVTHIAAQTELQFEVGATSDVPPVSPETKSQSKAEFEINVPHVSLETESRSEADFKCDTPCFPLLEDNSEWKENLDPLSKIASVEDVSINDSIPTSTDNPLCSAEPCERIVFQDITEEIQSRATQFDGDEGVFVVEESSDDSELMNSEDFTEWSSSPIALMNQCLTSMDSELSSEMSAALTPEDVLAESLAKFHISERLETSNVEASPNMSSEFMQYRRYDWREGVDGVARLFNPVAAALIDAETDDVVCYTLATIVATILDLGRFVKGSSGPSLNAFTTSQ